jgi:hypothetical protein
MSYPRRGDCSVVESVILGEEVDGEVANGVEPEWFDGGDSDKFPRQSFSPLRYLQ